MQRAAQSLNVSPTIMKAHLRYLGVSKWPSRKRSTLHRLLRHAPDLQGHPRRKVSTLRLQGVCCLTSICSLCLLTRSRTRPASCRAMSPSCKAIHGALAVRPRGLFFCSLCLSTRSVTRPASCRAMPPSCKAIQNALAVRPRGLLFCCVAVRERS